MQNCNNENKLILYLLNNRTEFLQCTRSSQVYFLLFKNCKPIKPIYKANKSQFLKQLNYFTSNYISNYNS